VWYFSLDVFLLLTPVFVCLLFTLDGGVQRGTDICKALALGADSVGVGKPYLYGLAAGERIMGISMTSAIIDAYNFKPLHIILVTSQVVQKESSKHTTY
jgi:hypothetical protein